MADSTPSVEVLTPPPEGKRKKQRKPLSAAERKKRRRIIRLIIGGVILVGIGVFLFRTFGGGSGGGGSQPLTDFVTHGSITSKVEGSGMTRAKNSETVIVSFPGTIQDLFVEEGDLVSAGDPLFILDSEEARKAVTDAEDGVTRARDAVTTAQNSVRDAQESVTNAEEGVRSAEENVTSAEEGVDTALENVDAAQENVSNARQGVTRAQDAVNTARDRVKDAAEDLADAQKELSDTQAKRTDLDVKVPYTGKLLDVKKYVAGDKVAEDAVIATLVDDTKLRLTQYYSYAYAGDIYAGQPASVSVPSLMDTLDGVVEEVHMIARPSAEGSLLFSVDIVMDNPGAVEAGTLASATVLVDGQEALPYESAKLDWYRTGDVKAKAAGAVIATYLADYLPVQEGQVVLTLDDSELKDEIEEKEKNVEDKRKAVDNANDAVDEALKGVEDANRAVETARKGVETARKGVETARKGVESAKRAVEDARRTVTERQKAVLDAQKNVTEQEKGVAEAQEKVAKAQEELEKCNATAPIDGFIVGLNISIGEEVTSGKETMAVSDTSSILVSATVDSRNMSYIQKGMMVDLNQWDTPAVGIVDSISLSSTVNNGVATYPMVISADNTEGNLQVNSEITYSLIASQSEDCLIVPIQAVRSVSTEEGENLSVVYVRDVPELAVEGVFAGEEIPDGFYPVRVETGIQDTYNVEIKSGLIEDMEVFLQMQSSGNMMYW